jgi:electron transfer flavoprotein alpha subunit
MANDVWVYIEHKDGEINPLSFELLGIGKAIAGELGSNVCAFVVGEGVENIAKEPLLWCNKAYKLMTLYLKDSEVRHMQRQQPFSLINTNLRSPSSGLQARA